MTDRKVLHPEKIRLLEFRIIKEQTDSSFEFQVATIESFDYKINFNTWFHFEEEIVKADFTISIRTVGKGKKNEATGHYHFAFIYHVEGLKEFVEAIPDGTFKMDSYLGNAIASVTHSTARGLLLLKLQGTAIKDFILPVIDPNVLLQESGYNG